jgi:hypothetical protein
MILFINEMILIFFFELTFEGGIKRWLGNNNDNKQQ